MVQRYIRHSSRQQTVYTIDSRVALSMKYLFSLVKQQFSVTFSSFLLFIIFAELGIVAVIYRCIFITLAVNERIFEPIKLHISSKKFYVYIVRTYRHFRCFCSGVFAQPCVRFFLISLLFRGTV